MIRISSTELDFIFLGIKNNGTFDVSDIAKSELKKLGTGRILDSLGSLIEKKLLTTGDSGAFEVTNLARKILWDSKTPLWVRILKLLEIKSFDEKKIIYYLNEDPEKISAELEKIRKKGLVMRTSLRIGSKIEKMYEILPEGLEVSEKKIQKSSEKPDFDFNDKSAPLTIKEAIDDIRKLIDHQKGIKKKDKLLIINKLNLIESYLSETT